MNPTCLTVGERPSLAGVLFARYRSLVANERSPSTRDRLLDAALERFSRDGWGGTSIRDLARDVGVREGSVYKHFASKQAIFDALVDRADARMAEVAIVIHRHAADVHAHLARLDGDERLFLTAQGIKDFQHFLDSVACPANAGLGIVGIVGIGGIGKTLNMFG